MAVVRNGIDPVDMDPSCPFVGLEHIYSDGRIDSKQTVGSAGIRSTKHQFTKNHILFGKLRPLPSKDCCALPTLMECVVRTSFHFSQRRQ